MQNQKKKKGGMLEEDSAEKDSLFYVNHYNFQILNIFRMQPSWKTRISPYLRC